MYEKLLREADERGLTVIERYPFRSPRIRGLLCDDTIAISEQVDTTAERTVILCEEIDHADCSHGNILYDSRMERRARQRSYDRLVGLGGLVRAYLAGCRSVFEVSEFLDVPESFLLEALSSYRRCYGVMTTVCTKRGTYALHFEPTLRVRRLSRRTARPASHILKEQIS